MNTEDIFYANFTEYVHFIHEISKEIFEKLNEEKQLKLLEILDKVDKLMDVKKIHISYEYYYSLVKDYLKCIINLSLE
jgi:hypothetical protein